MEEYTVSFEPGPLGIVLNTEGGRSFIKSVVPDGQAAQRGVKEGDSLLTVAGAALAGLSHDEVLNLIRAAARPMAIGFSRAGERGGGGDAGAAAAAAVKKAGSFMKGLLGAGVQAIAGVEKLVGGAVDTTTMRATVRFFMCVCLLACLFFSPLPFYSLPPHTVSATPQKVAAQAVQSTRRLALTEMAGSFRGFSMGEGDALAALASGEGAEGLGAFAAANEAQLGALRAGNDATAALCVPAART